jgi:hypothetical protein
VQEHGAFSGLAEVVMMFAQHVSGALQIPLTRLLGQSPKGLGNEGESDVRTYYDNISQRQNRDMRRGMNTVYRLAAQSRASSPRMTSAWSSPRCGNSMRCRSPRWPRP